MSTTKKLWHTVAIGAVIGAIAGVATHFVNMRLLALAKVPCKDEWNIVTAKRGTHNLSEVAAALKKIHEQLVRELEQARNYRKFDNKNKSKPDQRTPTEVAVQELYLSGLLQHLRLDKKDDFDASMAVVYLSCLLVVAFGKIDSRSILAAAGGYDQLFSVFAASFAQGDVRVSDVSASVLRDLTYISSENMRAARAAKQGTLPVGLEGAYKLMCNPNLPKVLRLIKPDTRPTVLDAVAGLISNVTLLPDGAKLIADNNGFTPCFALAYHAASLETRAAVIGALKNMLSQVPSVARAFAFNKQQVGFFFEMLVYPFVHANTDDDENRFVGDFVGDLHEIVQCFCCSDDAEKDQATLPVVEQEVQKQFLLVLAENQRMAKSSQPAEHTESWVDKIVVAFFQTGKQYRSCRLSLLSTLHHLRSRSRQFAETACRGDDASARDLDELAKHIEFDVLRRRQVDIDERIAQDEEEARAYNLMMRVAVQQSAEAIVQHQRQHVEKQRAK